MDITDNLLTEKQAKKKVCPWRRWPVPDHNGVSIYYDAYCLASDCAAWRWRGLEVYDEAEDKNRRYGHCGRVPA